MAAHLFEIYFFGLICFHNNDPRRDADEDMKSIAGMVFDDRHRQMIFLNKEGFDLTTGDVRFDLPSGPVRTYPSFTLFVPHLVPLTKEDVTLRTDNSRPVHLPAGNLATVHNYRFKGEYELEKRKVFRGTGCIARINMLEVPTDAPEVLVSFNDEEPRRVSSDGFVLLANFEREAEKPQRPQPKEPRPKFKEHHGKAVSIPAHLADLFAHPVDCLSDHSGLIADHLIDVKKLVDNLPPRHRREVIRMVEEIDVAAHPECSNSQWP